MDNLPTSVIGLVAFLAVANIGALTYIVKYFLEAQKKQTDIYMEYIGVKNGHLEKARADFGVMIDDARKAFASTLQEQSNMHAAMLKEAGDRLEMCQVRNGSTK